MNKRENEKKQCIYDVNDNHKRWKKIERRNHLHRSIVYKDHDRNDIDIHFSFHFIGYFTVTKRFDIVFHTHYIDINDSNK